MVCKFNLGYIVVVMDSMQIRVCPLIAFLAVFWGESSQTTDRKHRNDISLRCNNYYMQAS